MKNYETKNITFNVFRFNSETDKAPHYEKYTLSISQDAVILDAMNRIKWEFDGSFSYRRSCRHGICGSCAIKVNNKPVLSCKENIFHLVELFGEELTLEPQDKQKAIKDMVVSKKGFWQSYSDVKPYLMADIVSHPKHENVIAQEQAELIDEADYCIECGNCYFACPVVNVNENFLGPAALLKAFRFNVDVRDNAKNERLDIVNAPGFGVWDCVKCYECAQACPKELSPIAKIGKLHNQIFEEGKAINNVATRHAIGFKSSIKKHGILDEGELVRYSEGNVGVLKHLPEALIMWKKGKIVPPWKMPKSKNIAEIQKLVDIASTAKF